METDEDIEIGRRTFENAAEAVRQDGYREGFDYGRKDSHQEGFDFGYNLGFKAGFDMSYYNTALKCVKEIRGPEESARLNVREAIFEKVERGGCILCPKVNRALNKFDMASIPSDKLKFENIYDKQELENENIKKDKDKVIKWLESFVE